MEPFIASAAARGVPLSVIEVRDQALEERYGTSCDPISTSPGVVYQWID